MRTKVVTYGLRAVALAALTGSAVLACSAATPAAPSGTSAAGSSSGVTIQGFAFSPATLSVAKGARVTFTNKDSAGHTVTSGKDRAKDGVFDQAVAGNSEAAIAFDRVGTFEYFCQLHGSMKGTITVK